MPTVKIAEAANLRCRLHRTRHNPLDGRPELLAEGFDHGVASLAQRDDAHLRIRVQVVKVFAHAQDAALAMHVSSESLFDGSLIQRMLKDGARRVTHLSELRFSRWIGHASRL